MSNGFYIHISSMGVTLKLVLKISIELLIIGECVLRSAQ